MLKTFSTHFSPSKHSTSMSGPISWLQTSFHTLLPPPPRLPETTCSVTVAAPCATRLLNKRRQDRCGGMQVDQFTEEKTPHNRAQEGTGLSLPSVWFAQGEQPGGGHSGVRTSPGTPGISELFPRSLGLPAPSPPEITFPSHIITLCDLRHLPRTGERRRGDAHVTHDLAVTNDETHFYWSTEGSGRDQPSSCTSLDWVGGEEGGASRARVTSLVGRGESGRGAGRGAGPGGTTQRD